MRSTSPRRKQVSLTHLPGRHQAVPPVVSASLMARHSFAVADAPGRAVGNGCLESDDLTRNQTAYFSIWPFSMP